MLLDSDVEVLLTFAEVAAAFAGFSAVAGIFGERSKEIAQQDAERLRAVILNSILVGMREVWEIVGFKYILFCKVRLSSINFIRITPFSFASFIL